MATRVYNTGTEQTRGKQRKQEKQVAELGRREDGARGFDVIPKGSNTDFKVKFLPQTQTTNHESVGVAVSKTYGRRVHRISLRVALVLHLRWILEPAVNDRPEELKNQEMPRQATC